MKIILKRKIISPQFLIGSDFVTGRDNICQLDFLPHYQILLSGKYWMMRWIKTSPVTPSSKNPSFADLDRLKLAGEVFAYLAVPVYSVEKWEGEGGQWRGLAWLLRPPRASAAGAPWRTERASWAPAPPPAPPPGARSSVCSRQTCDPAESWHSSGEYFAVKLKLWMKK